jgi:hypothetical protein
VDQYELYIYLGVAAVFVLVIVLANRAAKRRRTAIEAVALQAGWQFAPDEVPPETLDFGAFPLFDIGRNKHAGNVLRGSSGQAALTIFDYRYTTGGGRSSSTTNQTVARIQSPRLKLPLFALSPENILHKIGGVFGYHDIDFDGSQEFSSQYLLRSKESEDAVRELFSPSVRHWFQHHPNLTVQGHADGVLVYRSGKTVKPEDLRTFAEEAIAVARLFER